MKTQELIKELGFTKAIEFLQAEPRNIKVKEYDNFVVLNYCQVFSKKDDDYVKECRSLQLDKQGNIISRAFPRFFNYGEVPDITLKFDFSTAYYFEKVDGSLVRVYWNPFHNKWECSTRGTAFAESEQDFFPTFREAIITDGFGLTEEEEFQAMCDRNLNPNNTYVFEYCSKKNRIVTLYEQPQMVLLAVINNYTGYEEPYESLQYNFDWNWFDGLSVRLVNRYSFSDYDAMKIVLDNLPDLQEGFVAQDGTGLRVKFKAAIYLNLHAMRGELGFTKNKMAAIIAMGEESEVLVYFPEYTQETTELVQNRENLFDNINKLWEDTKNIETQKDFALKVKDYPYSAIMFELRKGKQFNEIWDNLREQNKVSLILGE